MTRSRTPLAAPVVRRARRALVLALALLVGSALPALGQLATSSGQLAVRSDGFIFWIQDGVRHPVYPAALSDEQINALPEGAPLNASLQPGAAPPAPAPAAAPPADLPTGTSRADRLRLGQPCLCSIIRGTGQRSDLAIAVHDVRRDAWELIRGTNPTNQRPREGFEYVLVTLSVRYLSGATDQPISIDRFDFSMLDANDTLYVPAFVVEPDPLISQTVYPGSQVAGRIAYQVPRDDPNIVLVWRYNHDNPTWFAIQ